MMKDKALVLTPIYRGAIIPAVDLGFPRLFSELEPFAIQREVNINANRNRLQEIYRTRYALEYPFVFLIDSDVRATHEHLIELREAWTPGTTPCLRTKPGETEHVVGACCFLAGRDYMQINYMENPMQCQCRKLPKPFYVCGIRGDEI